MNPSESKFVQCVKSRYCQLLVGRNLAREQARLGVQSQQIISNPGPKKMIFGTWSMIFQNDGQLIIKNSDSKYITLLRDGRNGFDFITSDGQVRDVRIQNSSSIALFPPV